MTLAAFFMTSGSAPVFLTDVLVTAKDQGEFTGIFNRWYNGPSSPTYGYREVMYIRKVKIIKENYCVAWAGNVDDALEAVSNLESLIDYFPPENARDQIGKFIEGLIGNNTHVLMVAGIFDNNGVKQAQFWSNAENVFKTDKLVHCLTGTGAELLENGEIATQALKPSASSLDFAVSALMKCLINELYNPHFNKYRTGAYYELTYFEGGWKNISIPINIIKLEHREEEKFAKFVSYSRIYYNGANPLCISMNPFDFVVKGDASNAISALLIDPFLDKGDRETEFQFLDVLKEPSDVNITVVVSDNVVRAFTHKDPVLDFSDSERMLVIHEALYNKILGY